MRRPGRCLRGIAGRRCRLGGVTRRRWGLRGVTCWGCRRCGRCLRRCQASLDLSVNFRRGHDQDLCRPRIGGHPDMARGGKLRFQPCRQPGYVRDTTCVPLEHGRRECPRRDGRWLGTASIDRPECVANRLMGNGRPSHQDPIAPLVGQDLAIGGEQFGERPFRLVGRNVPQWIRTKFVNRGLLPDGRLTID